MSKKSLPECASQIDHLFLPEEYKNPDELYLGISILDPPEDLGVKLPVKLDVNFVLAKDIKDIVFPQVTNYKRNFAGVIPSHVIKKLYGVMPKNMNKAPNIFSFAFSMDLFARPHVSNHSQLYGLVFFNKTKGYTLSWVTSPAKDIIMLLSKFLYPRYGKLVGFFSSEDMEKYNHQMNQILSNERGIRLDDLIYDFREMDEEKASYHSLSREYPDLSPEEIAKITIREGKEIVEYAREKKGMIINIELSEEEEYKETVDGIKWARKEELKKTV